MSFPASARLAVLSGLASILLVAAPAQAITINVDTTVTDVIPGIAGFQTTGDLMAGMTVQAIFATGLNETLSWQALGPGSGGVSSASGWSLSLDGDSFSQPWNFTNNTDSGLVSLVLNGVPGLTVFDRTFGGAVGTTGSALGRDFVESPTVSGTATYSQQVAIGMNLPVGDIWHVLTVQFTDPLFGSFTFRQDTDNDIRRPPPSVPEPGTMLLLGAGMVIASLYRRRT